MWPAGEAEACSLCSGPGARYTCPRCNLRYCSLPCYRGARHRACAELFYRDAVLGELRAGAEARAGGAGLLREAEAWGPGEAEAWGPGEAEAWGPRRLWAALSQRQRADFQRRVASGEAAAWVTEWRPWWERRPGRRGPVVEELSEQQAPDRERENDGVRGVRPGSIREQENDGDGGVGPGSDREQENDGDGGVGPDSDRERENDGDGGVGPDSDRVWEMVDSVPPVHTTIAPLKSLSTKLSPLVQYSVVNVLYAYAIAMRLFNGDVSGEMRVEFVDTLLDVSQTLKASRVYTSTAEALQSGAQGVGNSCYPSNPFPAVRAMEDTSVILAGDCESPGGHYTLAAISHLIRILGKVKRSRDGEANVGRADYYRARKKCGFLLSWASEHRHALSTLSAEAQHEFAASLDHLLQVQQAKNSLEKAWGAKRPPERKVLIEELDP